MIELSSNTINIKISAHHDLTNWFVRTKINYQDKSISKANAKEDWGSDDDIVVDPDDPTSFVIRFKPDELVDFKNKNNVILYIELESPNFETLAVQQDQIKVYQTI